MAMQIGTNAVVSMNYLVATVDGEHVDKSEEGQPMVYLHGHGQIIPGLEAALEGRSRGEKITTTVQPADAYGDYDQELDLRVGKDAFPEDVQDQLKPGFQFMAEHPGKAGESMLFTVHRIEQDDVLVSGNHPLAGQTLTFTIEVLEVRLASADELSHGHAHGPGGHHHH
jgi:FKBP-type peptidyl-prolyl cis-trans isomerase SlyD